MCSNRDVFSHFTLEIIEIDYAAGYSANEYNLEVSSYSTEFSSMNDSLNVSESTRFKREDERQKVSASEWDRDGAHIDW